MNWTMPTLTEHDPDCPQPGWIWQAEIIPGLPILGQCRECGAVEKYIPPQREDPRGRERGERRTRRVSRALEDRTPD